LLISADKKNLQNLRATNSCSIVPIKNLQNLQNLRAKNEIVIVAVKKISTQILLILADENEGIFKKACGN
jgi:hypothetical protein